MITDATHMIQIIADKAQSRMFDTQVPLVVRGEEVDTTVYLHQRTQKEGLTTRHDCDGYHAPYSTVYEMLHASGKFSQDNDSNEICYNPPRN